MLIKLFDYWVTFVIFGVGMIVSGAYLCYLLIAYESGERVMIGSKIFALYEMTGKTGVFGLALLLAALFFKCAWNLKRTKSS